MKISVFGAGSWGTALAHQLARRGHELRLWARELEVVEGINRSHRNPLFLGDLDLLRGSKLSFSLTVAEAALFRTGTVVAFQANWAYLIYFNR